MAFASVPLKTNTVFSSANRINAADSADQNNYTYRGVIVVVDITGWSGGTNATFTIQGKDPESGKYYTVLASAAQTAAHTTATGPLVLQVYPGMAASANLKADQPLPKTWRVSVTKTGTFTNLTYSVSATMIP